MWRNDKPARPWPQTNIFNSPANRFAGFCHYAMDVRMEDRLPARSTPSWDLLLEFL